MGADFLPAGMQMFRAYGLAFSSELRFDHVPETSIAGEADVRICRGQLNGPNYAPPPVITVESSPGQLLIRGVRSATILVRDGKRITIEPLPGGNVGVIRQLVLGWALAGIFHQRGMLPLHASALCDGRAAFVFCAAGGVGKSTLAAAFLNKGFTFLDDNVAVVRFCAGTAVVVPGAPELRLWDDALADLAFEHRVVGPIRSGLAKQSVTARGRFRDEEAPIRKVFVLRRMAGQDIAFADLAGKAKFQALMENVFGLRLVGDPLSRGKLFHLVRELAAKVEVIDVHLPARMPSPAELARLLLVRGMFHNSQSDADGSKREGG